MSLSSSAIPDPSPAGAGDAILQATGLTKVYQRAPGPALSGLDLTVYRGEIFGLLGPNGAGKTTAIAIMSTMLRSTSGDVSVCGLDVMKQKRRVRKRIGIVPQDVALFDNLSAKENLTYFGTLYGLSGRSLRNAVGEGLELAGLTHRANHLIKQLSGGMKRRINLAAGILHRPELLFLDEPTVGVDAQSRNLILEKLQQLKSQGITMIYTTHYFEEAELLCSRIAVMDYGRVILQGMPKQLIEREKDCDNLSDLFLKLTGRQLRD